MWVETPDQMIVSARQLFDFSCFLAEAIFEGNITPATLPRKIKLDTGGQGVFVEGHFTQEALAAIAAGSRMNALGTLAIATDSAMDFVFGAKDAQDMYPLGSARSIVYQIRCAYAHDQANPAGGRCFQNTDTHIGYRFRFRRCQVRWLLVSSRWSLQS